MAKTAKMAIKKALAFFFAFADAYAIFGLGKKRTGNGKFVELGVTKK